MANKEDTIELFQGPRPPPYAPLSAPPAYETYQSCHQSETSKLAAEGKSSTNIHLRTLATHLAQPGQTIPLIPPDCTYLAAAAVISFFPLGLIAMHMAIKSKKNVAAGNFNNAWGEAKIAKKLSHISILIAVLLIIAMILAIVLPLTL